MVPVALHMSFEGGDRPPPFIAVDSAIEAGEIGCARYAVGGTVLGEEGDGDGWRQGAGDPGQVLLDAG